MGALIRGCGLLALLATFTGCFATNSDNLLSALQGKGRPRNDDFDPSVLVGKDWDEASRIIRKNGWLCEFTGPTTETMPPEIDFKRLSPERQQELGPHRLLITLKIGTVVTAQKTQIL